MSILWQNIIISFMKVIIQMLIGPRKKISICFGCASCLLEQTLHKDNLKIIYEGC